MIFRLLQSSDSMLEGVVRGVIFRQLHCIDKNVKGVGDKRGNFRNIDSMLEV